MAEAPAGFRAGVASVVITPESPMWAAGYGSRDRPTAEREHDLFAKALVIEDAHGERLLFVTSDLLGFSKSVADSLVERIMQKHRFERRQVCLTSSHTHSGPVLRDALVDIYLMRKEDWSPVESYSDRLNRLLLELVDKAVADVKPATLAHGNGTCGFAMNRRENSEGEIFKQDQLIAGAVVKGPVDHDVPVLRVSAPDGALRAVLFGYACHCTTMAYYKWCGDYAGFAQAAFEAAHPGATGLFFAGCGGDINPMPRRKIELCRDYGEQLAGAVGDVLDGDMTLVTGRLQTRWRMIDLPYDKLPTREELEAEAKTGGRYEKNRAERFLAQLDRGEPLSPTYPYPLQVIQFGEQLTAVVMGGEVVVDYSLRLKRELGEDKTWVVAYANDVMAYIPSLRVLREGGYEGATSMAVYGLPALWSPTVEETLVEAIHELVTDVRK